MTTDRADAPASTEIELPIEGMTCASCVNRIERFLNRTEGVETATVNLATDAATIRYLPDVAGRADLVEAVEAAGYDVREVATRAADAGAAPVSLLEEFSATTPTARARSARCYARRSSQWRSPRGHHRNVGARRPAWRWKPSTGIARVPTTVIPRSGRRTASPGQPDRAAAVMAPPRWTRS